MAYALFWLAGLATVAGATLFTLSGQPRLRIAGMGATFLGILGLLIFWKAPALYCLIYLAGGASTFALLLLSFRLFPSEDSLVSRQWGRHFLAAVATWGFSYGIQQGIARIPVGAYRTSVLAPDSDSFFSLYTGNQLSLVVLLFFVFVFAGSGIKGLGKTHPLGGGENGDT